MGPRPCTQHHPINKQGQSESWQPLPSTGSKTPHALGEKKWQRAAVCFEAPLRPWGPPGSSLTIHLRALILQFPWGALFCLIMQLPSWHVSRIPNSNPAPCNRVAYPRRLTGKCERYKSRSIKDSFPLTTQRGKLLRYLDLSVQVQCTLSLHNTQYLLFVVYLSDWNVNSIRVGIFFSFCAVHCYTPNI